jgi:hypothetical protein
MTDDFVKRLRVLDPVHHLPVTFSQYCYAAADRIEELEEALRLADAALSGANMNMNVVQKKVRAALGETK